MAWCALQGKYDMLSLRVRLKPPCLNDIKLIVIAWRWPNLLTGKRPTSCCALLTVSPVCITHSQVEKSKACLLVSLLIC